VWNFGDEKPGQDVNLAVKQRSALKTPNSQPEFNIHGREMCDASDSTLVGSQVAISRTYYLVTHKSSPSKMWKHCGRKNINSISAVDADVHERGR
jgi:hypothetical protein